MTKKTLTFDAKNPFPVALNTYDDVAQLLANEVQKNTNILRMPNGELITHPRWGVIDAREIIDNPWTNCNRIIVDFPISTIWIETQLLIFGHRSQMPMDGGYSDQIGFVGRITEDNIDGDEAKIEMLIDGLNPYIVPRFVPYMKGVYITLGPQGIYYYDNSLEVINKSTEAGGKLYGIYANIGATLHERMWLAALIGNPGQVKFTKIGLEEIDSGLSCGDNGEVVTGLIPNDESMVITKVKEIYEYFWSDNITTGTLHTHTLKAGCVTHTLLQKHFEKIYVMGSDAVYIKSPKPVRAAGREVVVDPGITKVSHPIKNLIGGFKIPSFNEKVYTQTDFTTYLWKENVWVPPPQYGGNPRIQKSVKHTDQEMQIKTSTFYIEYGHVYGQSFKPSQKCIGTDIYILLAKTEGGSGTKIRISVYNDDGGVPGSNCKYTEDVDTGSMGGGYNWVVMQLETGGSAPYIFEDNTIYWVTLKSLNSEAKYTWYCCVSGPPSGHYERGYGYTNDPYWFNAWPGPPQGIMEGPHQWSDFVFDFMVEYYLKDTESWIISNAVELSGIDHWQSFNAGSTTPSGTDVKYYIRAFNWNNPDGDWQAIDPGAPIPDDLKFVTKLQWKAVLSSDDYTKTPSLNTIFFYGICYKETELIGSGFRNDRYYIFAKDSEDTDITLIFSKDGWLQTSLDVDDNLFAVCRHCHEDAEINDIKIAGCGEDFNIYYGCLFKALEYSDEKYRDMPIEIKTGKILLDEIPKKGRKIFKTYQGENVVLKIDAEDGTHTFNLADATSEFGIEEINFRTERTKWVECEITAAAKFKLKELSFNYKEFPPSEV